MEGLFVSPGMVKTDFPAKHSFHAYSHSSDVKKKDAWYNFRFIFVIYEMLLKRLFY